MKATFTVEKGNVGNGFSILLPGVEISNPVKMLYNFDNNKPMGECNASLHKDPVTGDHAIKADILYNNAVKDYYPAVGVQVLEQIGDTITKCKLQYVSLCPGPNADPSIKKLSEQIKSV